MPIRRALWRCERCGQRFTTRHQWHACGRYPLDRMFARSEPHVRRLFDRVVALVRAEGPVTVIPQKSRIALQVRMRGAALIPQRTALRGHFVLARRHESPRFVRIDTASPRAHVHVFRLSSMADLDAEFHQCLVDAYRIGRQDHLAPPRPRSRPEGFS